MRPVSLTDEDLDSLDQDSMREFDGHEGNGLGRRRKTAIEGTETFLDLFDSYDEDEELGEDEDSALFEGFDYE